MIFYSLNINNNGSIYSTIDRIIWIYTRSDMNILSYGLNYLNVIEFCTYSIFVTSLQENSQRYILYTELCTHISNHVNDSLCDYAYRLIKYCSCILIGLSIINHQI